MKRHEILEEDLSFYNRASKVLKSFGGGGNSNTIAGNSLSDDDMERFKTIASKIISNRIITEQILKTKWGEKIESENGFLNALKRYNELFDPTVGTFEYDEAEYLDTIINEYSDSNFPID